MYHHYLGDPLEVLLLYEDGTGAIETVGSLADGLSPELLIPGQTWHGSWLPGNRDYAMLATTEWPAVEPVRRGGRRRRHAREGLPGLHRCAAAFFAERPAVQPLRSSA
jgi:hypothetical protein